MNCRCCFITLFVPTLLSVFCASFIKWIYPPVFTPVIQTPSGPVQGILALSRNGQEYWQFLGIPYAKPPTGNRKFLPPEPLESWKAIKQTTKCPPECAQLDILYFKIPMGQLDCLYLNVFVNGNKNNLHDKKPVLVWLHGGAFASAAAKMFHPDYFMDHDVIIVVPNYRLSSFGFLNLEDTNGPNGNMGLLDQNLALKWVQKNIASFGGNPNQVTLFGESAGAMSTHLHVLSPMSKGLFHRAIVQSNPANCPMGLSRNPKEVAVKRGKRLHCNVKTSEELQKCFENTKWQKLVALDNTIMEPDNSKEMFMPSIDGQFLKEHPENILKTGDFPDIPIMFGVTPGEASFRTARFEAYPELLEKLDNEWNTVLQDVLQVDNPIPEDIFQKIRKRYFANSRFSKDDKQFMQNFTDLQSDFNFLWPTHKSAIFHGKRSAPTYLYFFNYTSKSLPGIYGMFSATRKDDWLPGVIKIVWEMMKNWIGEKIFEDTRSRPFGVMHGESVFQLWNIEGFSKWMSRKDKDFSEDFVKVIVDFANVTNVLTFRNLKWPSVNEHFISGQDEYSMPYLLMDNEPKPRVIVEPHSDRMKFWNKLGDWEF